MAVDVFGRKLQVVAASSERGYSRCSIWMQFIQSGEHRDEKELIVCYCHKCRPRLY